jgi:four helix bundle protein
MAPARHYTELIVWQLAEEIRIEVFKLTPKPGFATDFKAKDQAEDSINSTCRNIAEGFGCETHAEFARFLEISRRSLNELHDVLHGALLQKYVSASELAPIRQLSRRIYPAFGRFIAYLKRTPDYRPQRGRPTHKAQGRTTKGQDSTSKRGGDRSDERKGNRTDPREPDRTDQRQMNRTDMRRKDRTDYR